MKKILLIVIYSFSLLGCMFLDFKVVNENLTTLEKQKNNVYTYNAKNYPVAVNTINSKGEVEEQIFNKPPERIVAMWQNSIETPLALGLGDRIVVGIGIPDKAYLRKEYQEEYSNIPMTGYRALDTETILMQEPDIIIGWHSTFSDKVLHSTSFWHNRGVNTFIATSSAPLHKYKTLQHEWDDIITLGRIFDKNEKARQIVEEMKNSIENVKTKTGDNNDKKKVLIIEYMGKNVRVYGETTLAGDIVKQLNGNLLASKEVAISIEQIIDMDPDVIFMIVCERDYGREEKILNYVTHNEALSHIRCVKNKRVIPLPLYAVYAAGVRSYDGIKIIAEGMFPELYENKE